MRALTVNTFPKLPPDRVNRCATKIARTKKHLPKNLGESITGHWLISHPIFLGAFSKDGLPQSRVFESEDELVVAVRDPLLLHIRK